MVEYLLVFGANPNYSDSNGETTVAKSCYHGNKKMIELLLNNKNKIKFMWNNLINKCSTDDYSTFLWCCAKGSLECLKYLFSIQNQYQAKINIYQKSNDTKYNGLMAACSDNQTAMIKYLINNVFKNDDNKFNVNERDDKGRTGFWRVSMKGNVEICQLLKKKFPNCDLNKRNNEGMSPLIIAANNKHANVVSWLLSESSCLYNTEDCEIHLALLESIKNGSLKVASII